jgi:hypothetical protein
LPFLLSFFSFLWFSCLFFILSFISPFSVEIRKRCCEVWKYVCTLFLKDKRKMSYFLTCRLHCFRSSC